MKENFRSGIGVAEMKFMGQKINYAWKESERNRYISKELKTELMLNKTSEYKVNLIQRGDRIQNDRFPKINNRKLHHGSRNCRRALKTPWINGAGTVNKWAMQNAVWQCRGWSRSTVTEYEENSTFDISSPESCETWRQVAVTIILEVWQSSEYLEKKLCHQNCSHEASANRLSARRACYHSVQNPSPSRLLSLKNKYKNAQKFNLACCCVRV
jgi:hypothetical protein